MNPYFDGLKRNNLQRNGSKGRKSNTDIGTEIKMGLEMLHTDELLEYYKEVVTKGKRDFVLHHKQQNLIKKLEFT